MLTSRTYHRYVSGWCSNSMHQRCAGSYAGTPCSCTCHADLPGAGGVPPAHRGQPG